MISKESALRHTTKYRQLQSDISKVISDLEDYVEQADDTIYISISPENVADTLYQAKDMLEDIIVSLINSGEDEISSVSELS